MIFVIEEGNSAIEFGNLFSLKYFYWNIVAGLNHSGQFLTQGL
jgi:hypothetical protein